MKLNRAVLDSLCRDVQPRAYLRMTPLAFRATPLGMGFGKTRFASPADAFKVLYIAPTLLTGVAETIARDRFVDRQRRRLTEEEIESWGAAEVTATEPLSLLDLRTTGLMRLGRPTDAVRAKSHRSGRRLSAEIYQQAPDIDGILYPSRLTNGDCVAVYDRAVRKFSAGPVHDIVGLPTFEQALPALDITIIRR